MTSSFQNASQDRDTRSNAFRRSTVPNFEKAMTQSTSRTRATIPASRLQWYFIGRNWKYADRRDEQTADIVGTRAQRDITGYDTVYSSLRNQ